jgi:DNA-binding CsgD family transcriptional regulator
MSPGSRDESTGVPTLPGNLADVLSAIHALTGPGFCLAAQGNGQSARDRQRALLSIVQWLCGCALVAGLRSDIGQEQRLPGRMFLLEATFDTAQENSAVGGYLSDGPRVALTQREIDVLQLVALGESNREIADSLFISTPTVKRHLTNILGKLGASSRHEAVLFARSHGHG